VDLARLLIRSNGLSRRRRLQLEPGPKTLAPLGVQPVTSLHQSATRASLVFELRPGMAVGGDAVGSGFDTAVPGHPLKRTDRSISAFRFPSVRGIIHASHITRPGVFAPGVFFLKPLRPLRLSTSAPTQLPLTAAHINGSLCPDHPGSNPPTDVPPSTPHPQPHPPPWPCPLLETLPGG